MKIGVSNLAWSPSAESDAFRVLAANGAEAIEVAPTRISDWDSLSQSRLLAYRRGCEAAGLQISSLQAIFFNKPAARFLGDAPSFGEMKRHLARIGEIAEKLDAKIAVFGAPRNRRRDGMPLETANSLAVERFWELGEIIAGHGLTLGIEPVPEYYGGDFLSRANEVVAIVQQCGHPNVRAHFDIGCITLGGDVPAVEIRKSAGIMAHFHVSEPDLGAFDSPVCDHPAAAVALRDINYGGWVVIEMKDSGVDDLSAVTRALTYVSNVYGETPLSQIPVAKSN